MRDDIPSKEITSRKSDLSLPAAQKPPDVPKANCFDYITKVLDFHGKSYENIIAMYDLNKEDTDEVVFDLIS